MINHSEATRMKCIFGVRQWERTSNQRGGIENDDQNASEALGIDFFTGRH